MIPNRPHFDPPSDKDKLIKILQKWLKANMPVAPSTRSEELSQLEQAGKSRTADTPPDVEIIRELIASGNIRSESLIQSLTPWLAEFESSPPGSASSGRAISSTEFSCLPCLRFSIRRSCRLF